MENPKPTRNWRGFLKEYAIIVVGVLTALAAQQAAEKLHDRGRAAEARASIRDEAARNLGQIERRQATEACMDKRLDEVSGLIAASAAGKLPQDAIWVGMPIIAGLVDGKYKTAVQSGAVSLFSDEEQRRYAYLYGMFEGYIDAQGKEMEDWAQLRTLESHPPASPVLDWQLRNALQMARTHRWGIHATRLIALKAGAALGIAPAKIPNMKMPYVCVPLHTPRPQAMKMTYEAWWGIEVP